MFRDGGSYLSQVTTLMKIIPVWESTYLVIRLQYAWNSFTNSSNSLVGLWYGAHSGVTSATPLWAPYHRPDGCEWVLKLHSICNHNDYVLYVLFQISADDLFCSAYWFWTFYDKAADFVIYFANFICGIYWPNLECNSYCCLGLLPAEFSQHFVCRVCTKRWDDAYLR